MSGRSCEAKVRVDVVPTTNGLDWIPLTCGAPVPRDSCPFGERVVEGQCERLPRP